MLVNCDQNEFGLKNIDEPAIYAWMHDDEPENGQWNSTTNQYDPCVGPAEITMGLRNKPILLYL